MQKNPRPLPDQARNRRMVAREHLADSDWMLERVAAGRTVRQIARELRVSTGAVASWLRRHGLVAA